MSQKIENYLESGRNRLPSWVSPEIGRIYLNPGGLAPVDELRFNSFKLRKNTKLFFLFVKNIEFIIKVENILLFFL